jgi:hypothetical protein
LGRGEFLPETLPGVLRQFPARPGVRAVHKRFTEGPAETAIVVSQLRKRSSAPEPILPGWGNSYRWQLKNKVRQILCREFRTGSGKCVFFAMRAGNYAGVVGWFGTVQLTFRCFSDILGEWSCRVF